MTHARLSVLSSLFYLCVVALLLYFVRDFWRICMWGFISYLIILVALAWKRRRWEAAFRFVSWTIPLFLVFALEIGFAGNHYARSLADEWDYPKADRVADSTAKELIRSNPRRTLFEIPVHAPIESEFFNINADGYRARDFSQSSDADIRAIVVGGSTVFGTDVADSNTLPSRLQANYQRGDLSVEVINLGQEFLDIERELKAVRKFAAVIDPQVVIFYHGANDYFYSWEEIMESEQGGLVLEDTLKNRLLSRIRDSFFLASLRRLVSSDQKEEAVAEKRAQLIDTAVARYARSREAAEDYCREQSFQCVFFLQPYITNKDPLSYSEKVRLRRDLTGFPGFGDLYDEVCEALLARFPETLDVRDALDGVEETVYFDLVHVNGTGNEMLARAILSAMPEFPDTGRAN